MDQIAGRPYWIAQFDADGGIVGTDQATLVGDIAGSAVTDLFVMSHGWNNDVAGAKALYASMFPLIAAATAAAPGPAEVGFLGVIWPSILFPDDPGAAVAGGGDAQAEDHPDPAPVNVTTHKTGAEITAAMAESFPAADHQALADMGRLIDQGLADAAATPEAQRANVAQFHHLLQEVCTPTGGAVEDDGELSLLTSTDPVQDYRTMAAAMATDVDAGDAQGIGNVFHTVWNGAKDALRVASFWKMKQRAGTVGRNGLGPLLEGLHGRRAQLRVHLIGHSFGARLVANSLAGISTAAASPVSSLLLVQGAFSHWAFAPNNPWGQGSLVGTADRVRGPLAATFTAADWAVGTWYPKASFLSGDDQQAAGQPGRWGGMGSDGFQGCTPWADLTMAPGETTYVLTAGTFHRVDANAVINNTSQSAFAGAHSDILRPEVAALAAGLAAASAAGG